MNVLGMFIFKHFCRENFNESDTLVAHLLTFSNHVTEAGASDDTFALSC